MKSVQCVNCLNRDLIKLCSARVAKLKWHTTAAQLPCTNFGFSFFSVSQSVQNTILLRLCLKNSHTLDNQGYFQHALEQEPPSLGINVYCMRHLCIPRKYTYLCNQLSRRVISDVSFHNAYKLLMQLGCYSMSFLETANVKLEGLNSYRIKALVLCG